MLDLQVQHQKVGGEIQLVNLGCGATCHPAWLNLDVEPRLPGVGHWDVRVQLPFPDGKVDAVYTSHLLEHLAPEEAQRLARDIHRIIRSRGVIRIVVPDLESICRTYLQMLEAAWTGVPGAAANYDWMVIELLDQVARAESGGRMGPYLLRARGEERTFVLSRIGMEAERFWSEAAKPPRLRLGERLRQNGSGWAIRKARQKLAELAAGIVGGRGARDAFREGAFRSAGEVHRWMYDRYSLKRLLESAGFVEFTVCDPWTSGIPAFARYDLDTLGDRVRKPDSIFVEAIRP